MPPTGFKAQDVLDNNLSPYNNQIGIPKYLH